MFDCISETDFAVLRRKPFFLLEYSVGASSVVSEGPLNSRPPRSVDDDVGTAHDVLQEGGQPFTKGHAWFVSQRCHDLGNRSGAAPDVARSVWGKNRGDVRGPGDRTQALQKLDYAHRPPGRYVEGLAGCGRRVGGQHVCLDDFPHAHKVARL